MKLPPILVIGALNTDILGAGVPSLVGVGELCFGGQARIVAGGKARNVAQMMSVFPEADIRMLGKTGRDPYGLWKLPLEALQSAGVDTTSVLVDEQSMPGIALIPIDKNGRNQIYVLPGANAAFSPDDIQKSSHIFDDIASQNGCIVLSLEIPISTVACVIEEAKKRGIRILIDPGGMQQSIDYQVILQDTTYLLKPNVHEAAGLSGLASVNRDNAAQAAAVLQSKGVKNILITLGAEGAYFSGTNGQQYIPIPNMNDDVEQTDETGCGDQVMATLSLLLTLGWDMEHAAKCAIAAGSLQYRKIGVQPLSYKELQSVMI